MSLPKWIESIQDNSRDCSEADELLEALSIAYQALEAIQFGSLEANFKQCTQTDQEIAEEALRRIEELQK